VRGIGADSFDGHFRALCRTLEKMGSYARICRQIPTLTSSRLQLAADCRRLRKKELKTGY